MKEATNTVDAAALRAWLEEGKPVFVLDVRPLAQREEWYIPGSHYLDAYSRLKDGDNSVLDDIEIPENAKVVTVCALGRTAQIAADALRQKGVDAVSLEGGMKAWSTAWNVAKQQFEEFEVLQLRRTGKGCLSYIISSGKEAVIIDASLPVDVYEQLVQDEGLSVKYIIETHIHADHVSRSKELAARFNAPLFLPVDAKVRFPFNKITADTAFVIGSTTLQAIPTPGHTIDSYSFYIPGKAVFTGDTLFTNGVGRPDLKADEAESRQKAAMLYESLQKLRSLPSHVMVLPAHTSKPVEFDGKMISAEIREINENVIMLHATKDDFINSLLQKIPPAPANYLLIVEKNLNGDASGTESTDLEAGANRCAVS